MNHIWDRKLPYIALFVVIICILGFIMVTIEPGITFSRVADNQLSSPLELSSQDIHWVNTHPNIYICTDNNFPPIEFTNSKGEYSGIAPDILALIEKKTGLNIIPMQSGSFAHCIDSIQNNKTDLLGAVYISDLRKDYLIYSDPYLEPPLVFLTKNVFEKDLTFDTIRDQGLTIAVVNGYTSHELLIQKYPEIKNITVTDVKSGLYLTSIGTVDVFFGDLATATYFAETGGISNLNIAGVYSQDDIQTKMAFGISKDTPELAHIINIGLSSITPVERDEIMKKWISPSLVPPLNIYRAINGLILGIAIALLAVLIFVFWNRSLQRIVKEQTSLLLHDIEERKKIESALFSSEEKYRALFENNSNPLLICDEKGSILLVNNAFSHVTGLYEQDLKKISHWSDLITYPEDWKKIIEYQSRGIESSDENKDSIDSHITTKNGEIREVVLTCAKIPGSTQLIISFIDVTERNQTRDIQRLANLIDFIPDAIFALNNDGVVIAWNRAIEEMTGIKSSEMIGKGNYEYSIPFYGVRKPILINLTSLSIEELHQHQYTHIERAGNFLIAESRETKPKGINRILKGFAAPLFDETGNVVGAIEGVHDITDLTLAEEALRESEANYRAIVDTSPAIIFSLTFLDDKKIITSINPIFTSITGWNVDEWIGKPIINIFHPDDHSLFLNQTISIDANKKYSPISIRIVTKSGEYLEGNYISSPIHRDGINIGELGIFLDVTELRKAESELRSSEAELRALFSSIIDVVIVLDSDGRYLKIAPTNPENLYKPADQLIGKTLFEVFPDKAEYYMSHITHCLKTREPVQFEYSLPIHEKMVWFSAIVSPMTENTVILVARDISELKLSEEAIMLANKKLNLLSKITRHDIINLLAGLSGYISLSLELVTDKTVSDYLKKAEQGSYSIQRQINFTREYQDVGIYKPGWKNIGVIVDNLIPTLLPDEITCTHTVINIEVFADPLLEKVFYTLFENSIRHGENVTEIKISYQENNGILHILYEDNGVGIEQADKERIFERGFGKHTGFGLFLSKEILSITGLSIRETGQTGNGVRFEIIVPKGSFRYVKPKEI